MIVSVIWPLKHKIYKKFQKAEEQQIEELIIYENKLNRKFIGNPKEEEKIYHAELKKKLARQQSNRKYLLRNYNNLTNN